jgi:hypothetical protein
VRLYTLRFVVAQCPSLTRGGRLREPRTAPARAHFSTVGTFRTSTLGGCLSECVGVGRVHCLCMPSADDLVSLPAELVWAVGVLRGDPTPFQTTATARDWQRARSRS